MIETKIKPDSAPVTDVEFSIPSESDYTKNTANSIGFKPIFSYYGIPIQHKQIYYCHLTSGNFIPEVHLYFYDNSSIIKNEGFPLDNTIISMLIRSSDDKLRPVRIDFKILNFKYLKNENLYYIHGMINVDSLYNSPFKSYSNKTSFDVMQDFSQESKIGFATNIPNTNDKMNWLNPGLPNIHFIQDTISKAYKDDNSFLWGFVDYFYTLNYIDVEKQLRNSDDNPAIITVDRLGNSVDYDKSLIDNIILTNEPASTKAGYEFTFTDYRIFNDSTQISLNQGYKQQIYFYDRSGNWDKKAGMFLKHDLNSLIRPNAETNSIILKDMPDQTGGLFKSNVKAIFAGVLDVDNTHTNYHYAKHQNRYNLEEIQKVYMEIDMTQPNFNIYKFENIDIGIVEANNGLREDIVNRRLTGRWLVTGIDFHYYGDQDRFTQTVTLVKRELGA